MRKREMKKRKNSTGIERKNVFWFILFRLIVITALLASVVVIQHSTSIFLPTSPFYYLVFIFYFLSFAYFLLYFWGKSYALQVYLQICFDFLLITVLVYISGGLKSSFYFLYIFEIIAASLFLSHQATYLVSAVSAITFGLLVEGMYFGIIPSFSVEQNMNISPGLALNNIFIAWSVFFLVSLLMNYITGSLRKTKSELQSAKAELEIRERLAIAGEVSAQLAHEIRNPLAAISGSVQVLKDELKMRSGHKELMDIIVKESKRISHSIDQFQDLTSVGKKTFSRIDLASVLKETLILLRRSGELDGNCRLKGNYQSVKIPYFGSANHFRQIYWNLIRNSLKAMPTGGTLTIDLSQEKNNGLQLRFADTGRGMTEEEKENIFEPFYSGFGNGMGMGMSVVRRIIDDYNGNIQVFSQLSQGTEIVITLPPENRGRGTRRNGYKRLK